MFWKLSVKDFYRYLGQQYAMIDISSSLYIFHLWTAKGTMSLWSVKWLCGHKHFTMVNESLSKNNLEMFCSREKSNELTANQQNEKSTQKLF